MKKWVIIAFIVIFVLAILTGIFIFNMSGEEKKIANGNNIINEDIQEGNEVVENNITINTNVSAEKISPNAVLTVKKEYQECGHVIREYKEMPEELVNLTKEELQEKYQDIEIEKFSSLDIILLKQEEGVCDEHYILKEKDGVIAVYKIETDGTENLEELTGISMEYLTDKDKEEIQQGIKVYGLEELNGMLENYE